MFLQKKFISEDLVAFEIESQRITYKKFYNDLKNLEKKINFKNKKIFFLLAENNYEFVLIYFVLLKKKYPFFLIDKNINKKNLKNLIKKFSPNYILSKEKKLLNLKLSKKLLNFNIFNNSNKNYNINKNLCLLLPTSGSTGSPKFVMLSRQNILKNTKDICRYLKLNKNNITISTLPFHYSYGLSILNTHIYSGSKIIFSKYNIMSKEFWRLFNKKKINSIYGVPQSFEILKKLRFNPTKDTVKIMAVAGGSIKKETLEIFYNMSQKKNFVFYNMYGQTEASPRISFSCSRNKSQSIFSVGKSFGGGKIIVKDQNNKSLNKNEIGKIIYHGKNVMIDYATNIKHLSNKRKNNYYLETGDYGYKNSQGDLFIYGRESRYAKIRGLRINLDDIEKFLNFNYLDNKCIQIGDLIYIFVISKYNKYVILDMLSKKFNLRKNDFHIKYIKKFKYLSNGKIDLIYLKKVAKN